MYALLQSKDPRLFSSAVATNASFITALALAALPGSIRSFSGSALGQHGQFCYFLCYWGVGTPSVRRQEGCCGLEKDKQSHPPRMIISGDLPSRLRYESRAAHDKPGLCITHKDTLLHKLKTHKFAMMKTCV